jgi:glycosyltransferase involved in cell wall biosynthesis
MTSHDVAIYATSSFSPGLYDRAHGRAGGAERQMTLLARTLAEHGYRVGHIVYPPRDPIALPSRLDLVAREPYAGDRRVVGGLIEGRRIWRALSGTDAAVTIFRTGSPAVGIGALFSRLHRRRFVFSSSNVSDFTLETMPNRSYRELHALGMRLADAVVVQSQDQLQLARRSFPSLRRIVHIPSFAAPAPASWSPNTSGAEWFLWVGRAVPYKQPMRYVELARAVPDARFVMIAVAEGARAPELARVVAAAQEVPNLELREPVPHHELSQLIACAVAVVNTSKIEGMPNAFLEAWAQGVPVLTLEFDPDAVVAREELGIAAAGSWERFVAGAGELWNARERRRELVARTRAYVQRVHSIDAVAATWSELIDDLAATM